MGRYSSSAGGDGLGCTEIVDLDHVRDDAAAAIDCEASAALSPADRGKAAHCHEAPVAGLDPGRADALVPDLGGLLVGGHSSGVVPVANAGSSGTSGRTFRRG